MAKFLFEPRIFQRIVDIFVDRYRHLEIDVIAGYVVFLVCLCGCGAAEETQAVGSRGFFSCSCDAQSYSEQIVARNPTPCSCLTIFFSFLFPFLVVWWFVRRSRTHRLDARGFVLGPPIALALQKPFVMMRKKGKLPNSVSSTDYITEYGNRSGLTVQRDKISEGHKVLIIDDLVATGGTLGSAISLVKMLGGHVVECACVVELKMFVNPPDESKLPSRTKLFHQLGHHDTPVWGLVSEDILTEEAPLPDDYVDDGEEH